MDCDDARNTNAARPRTAWQVNQIDLAGDQTIRPLIADVEGVTVTRSVETNLPALPLT